LFWIIAAFSRKLILNVCSAMWVSAFKWMYHCKININKNASIRHQVRLALSHRHDQEIVKSELKP
jgi:hypothetical protein